MSTFDDRKVAAEQSEALRKKTEAALASIARKNLMRERNGAMVGVAAGGFGKSASQGWLHVFIKYMPFALGIGFSILAAYALALAVA